MSSEGKKDWRAIDHAHGCIREKKGLNKNELADFVHTVKVARTCQRVVAVVDQHRIFVYSP